MKAFVKRTFLVLAGALCLASGAVGAEFQIHDGDRVVFLGDSITEQRLYTTYIEAYALTRHPEWKLWFRNVGWGGDTSWLRQRSHPDEAKLFAAEPTEQQRMVDDAVGRGLGRDVMPLKPTFVTVKFGMNDHAYQPFREDIFRAYVRSQAQIAKIFQANHVRAAFLTPQPIEEIRPDPDKDPRNQSLRRFCDGLREVAASGGATFVDQFDPYMAMLLRERAGNPASHIGGGDAVHPGPIGHTVMAWAVLKGLGASPLVSEAEIDCAGQKVAAADHCRVDHLRVSGGAVSFDRLDEALPMPIDPKADAALKLAPVLDDLDRYELKVNGLAPGQYSLSIDGGPAGTVSADELAKGCNLATKAGPITAQAQQVLRMVFEKNNLFFKRWRDVELWKAPEWAQGSELEAKRQAEIAHLDNQIAQFEHQIDLARKPRNHHFELKPEN